VRSASAPRPAERNRSETRPGRAAWAGAQKPRLRRSDGVWQDQDSNLGRRKPAILQAAILAPRRSLDIPIRSRLSAMTCANGQPKTPAVTRRPSPLRRVPRGLASGGAKMERNPGRRRPTGAQSHGNVGIRVNDSPGPLSPPGIHRIDSAGMYCVREVSPRSELESCRRRRNRSETDEKQQQHPASLSASSGGQARAKDRIAARAGSTRSRRWPARWCASSLQRALSGWRRSVRSTLGSATPAGRNKRQVVRRLGTIVDGGCRYRQRVRC